MIENQGMGSLIHHDMEVISLRTEVPLETRDAFVDRHGIESRGLIKSDIQGGETMFFRGGTKSLCRFRPPLLLEGGSHELAASGSNPRTFLELVESLGYRAHLLEPDGRPGARIQSRNLSPHFDASNVLCLAA
jgi:hypothetical protein